MPNEPISAPNLTQRPPRSPRVRLGGYVILARILDKGRATVAGETGEYQYNSGMDQHWLRFVGIEADALKDKLAQGLGDGEILAWVEESSTHKRQPWEIQHWSSYLNERGPDSDSETLSFFAEKLGEKTKSREDIKTWFDLLDLDDHVSFGGKA